MLLLTARWISLCSIIAVSFLVLTPCALSFVPPLPLQSSRIPSLAAALGDLSAPEPPPLDKALVEAARAKLPWEQMAEKEQLPLLNLSIDKGSSLSLSQEAMEGIKNDNARVENDNEDSIVWQNGEVWAETLTRLVDLWVLPRDMSNGADDRYAVAASKAELKMLEKVPQLLRLDTAVAAAETVLDLGLPPALLRSEPVLLSYPSSYIEGGMEFLGKMMMLSNKKEALIAACRDTPGLLAGAVEGWIQEQTVKRALGAAAEATSQTNKQVASDVAKAYRAVKGGGQQPGLKS